MLNIHRAYFYVFFVSVLGLFLAPHLLSFLDELCLLAFAVLAVVDMTFNRCLGKYKLMFVLLGVMALYLAYSLVASPYNIPKAQINDFIAQCKPLIAFSVSYAIAPQFTANEKWVLKKVCIFLAFMAFFVIAADIYDVTIFHIYYGGLTCVGCAMVYLLMSYDNDNPRAYTRSDLIWTCVILLLGLICTRSKYYGFVVLAFYMLFVYRPGTVNFKSVRNVVVATLAFVLVVLVAWKKIEYYFITGNSDTFDPDVMETYARPVLFGGMVLVLADHLLLGSGLATYATYSSGPDVSYSDLYYDYGINLLWGLSPTYGDFIADTFYPELAQFGLLGIFFFGYFCWWIWRKYRIVMRSHHYQLFGIGVMSFAFLAIDGTAGCAVLQASGSLLMAVMGIVAAQAKAVTKEEAKALLARPVTEFYDNKKEKIEYGYKF